MRRTLIFWNTVVLLVLFSMIGLTVRTVVHFGMFAAVDRELTLRTDNFLRTPPTAPPPRPRGPGRGNPFKIHLFDLSERSLSPPGIYPLWDRAAYLRCQRGQMLTTTIMRDGEPLRILSRPVYERGALIGVVQAPYPVSAVDQACVLLDQTLLALVPLVILSAWGGAALLTNRVLLPVRQLIAATERIGATSLSERLPVAGKDEFAVLATTFNRMLERLERAFERQRQFTADASHELKTPLTRIKGVASMALRGPTTPDRLLEALQRVDCASDAMTQLLQDLLLLAEADAGHLGGERTDIVVQDLVERACECVARPDMAKIVISLEPPTATLYGNEAQLLRVLLNLLENALRYTPPGNTVTLRSGPGRITIRDTGCGIAPEHLPHLGERFYRVDRARTRPGGGSGLGLAICQSIIAAHQGTLTIESVPGQGTTVDISLPPG